MLESVSRRSKYQPRIGSNRGANKIKDTWVKATFGGRFQIVWNGHSHYAQDITTKKLYYIFKKNKKLVPISEFWKYSHGVKKGDGCEMEFSPVYPLTILYDRYGGAYSGGTYTAWNLRHDNIPRGPDEDDISCSEFWRDNKTPVGRGTTPNNAVFDLVRRMAGWDDESHTSISGNEL